jgi:hypothetical protein
LDEATHITVDPGFDRIETIVEIERAVSAKRCDVPDLIVHLAVDSLVRKA